MGTVPTYYLDTDSVSDFLFTFTSFLSLTITL